MTSEQGAVETTRKHSDRAFRDMFWPRGGADARPWQMSLREWRRGCAATYQRVEGEYPELAEYVETSTHERVRPYAKYLTESSYHRVNRQIEWAAVRGTDYAPASTWGLVPGGTYEVFMELVPTPHNPHDRSAVAIELDGKKLGNLARRRAAWMHWKVRQLNARGLRVMVPGVVRAFYRDEIGDATPEAFIALPSLDFFDGLFWMHMAQPEEFRELWDALPVKLRAEIESDEFHLSEKTERAVVRAAEKFPELGLGRWHSGYRTPQALELMLRDVRVETREQRRREREEAKKQAARNDSNVIRHLGAQGLTRDQIAKHMGVSRGRVDTIAAMFGLQTGGRTRITEARKDDVVRLASLGKSKSVIERELRLGKGRAAKILSERGVEAPAATRQPGLDPVNRAALQKRIDLNEEVLRLYESGVRRADIAAKTDLAVSGIKGRISDARFLRDPSAYPERLVAALTARRTGRSKAQGATESERRAVSDTNALDLTHPGWDAQETA